MAFIMEGGLHAFEWRWRVISIRPSWEMGNTWVLALSLRRHSLTLFMTLSRSRRCFMSMKSMTIRPPLLRSLPTHFLGGFHVHAKDGAALIFAATLVTAGVYVNGD